MANSKITLTEIKDLIKQVLKEEKYPLYHSSFTSAINAALEYAKKQGYEYDDEETAQKIGMGPKKPSEGKTNRYMILLTKKWKSLKK